MGFSRGPQTVAGATPRPNGSGPQGRPTTSYAPPHPVHPVTTSSHQQAVQAPRPNPNPPQGRPTSSYAPPRPVHPVTTSSHQQAVQAARPNPNPPQGLPTSSNAPPQPVHPVTTSSHQQAVQAARPPTANRTASHARTLPHSTSHNLPHTNTNGNHVIPSVRNPPDGSSRSSSDYTNQGMQHRGPTSF
jgi:hypothetical protein